MKARLSSLSPRLASVSPLLSSGSVTPEGKRIKTQPGAHLYKDPRWKELRLRVLRRDGWRCRQTGVLLTGKYPAPDSPVVDHIVPHLGDEALFWDMANLQAVSKEWHDGAKQRQDRARLG